MLSQELIIFSFITSNRTFQDYILFLNIMAFVYRTLDKQNAPKHQILGPGSYFKSKKHIQSSEGQYPVPFNHSQNREIWKIPQVPGPGTYDTQTIIKKQKKLISDSINNLVIFQTPSESVPFKSKTIRFTTNSNSINPGPGEYETQPIIVRPQSGFKKPKVPSSQLKQFLKQKNNLLKISDNQYANLKDMVVSVKDQPSNQNFPQPKNIETQNNKQPKNSMFFASKVQRDINRIRPQTSAGPGSYNIAKSSFEIQKKYQKKSPVKSICIDKRVCKIQIEEVGPGYYQSDQAFKNLNQSNLIKKKKIQCFGSTVDRFQMIKTDSYTINPGPATYSLLNYSKSKNKKPNTSGTSFPKQQRKIFQPPKSAVLPISHNTVEDFSSLKKQKYQRKPSAKECFGSTKQRFCEKDSLKVAFTNPCINQSVNLIVSKPRQNTGYKNKGKQRMFYKTLINTRQKKKRFEQSISTSQTKIDTNPVVNRPLCYDNESNTFASKYNYKFQKDAPFMSGAERFKDKKQDKLIDLDVDERKRSKSGKRQKLSQEKMPTKLNKRQTDGKLGWIAVSKDERFKYPTKKQAVGPQYYDTFLPQKRSYNVLFAQGK